MTFLTALLAGAFALIHLQIGKLRYLGGAPRSWWLSAAGGIAVAYVFLHILPELSSHQEMFAKKLEGGQPEGLAYMVALTGLVVFYGLEHAARISRNGSNDAGGIEATKARIFWIHIASFGFYNFIIGYLLVHREEDGLWPLIIFFLAMALHFVTNNHGLRQDHQERYDRKGRWILAGAVVSGWGLGMMVALPKLLVGLLFAFIAGGVVLNALKEELPEERQSRFWPFALGCSAYAILFLAGPR